MTWMRFCWGTFTPDCYLCKVKFCFWSSAQCSADLGSHLWIVRDWLTDPGLALHHSDEFYMQHHCDAIKLPTSPLHLSSSLKKWSETEPSSLAYLRYFSLIWEKHMWNCPSIVRWCDSLLSCSSDQTVWCFGEGSGGLMGILWRALEFLRNHGDFPRGSVWGEEGSAGSEPVPPSFSSQAACGGSDLLGSVLPELFSSEPERCGCGWLGQEARSSCLGEMGCQQSNPLLSARGEWSRYLWYGGPLNLWGFFF